ncbi:MAG: 4-hydroxy-tetrahydrodipicolinate synthase [Bacillota bacterium]
MTNFGEVITAMVTPFTDELEVDYKEAAKLATYLSNHGSDGILVLGTTGEVPTLNEAEKLKLVEEVIEAVGEDTAVIVGSGCYSTADSIEFTKEVAKLGADGVMLVTPYYNKPPQSGLYQHFSQVAEATELPVILYNVPSRTGRNIKPETVAKLAEIDNIVAVKEASGDVEQAAAINRLTADDFVIYSGDDSLTLPILSVGGSGVISVASHLVGEQIKELVTSYKAGQVTKAANLNAQLGELFDQLFMTTNPIPVKKAVNLIGFEVGDLRPPLIDLTAQQEEELVATLEDYDLL